MSSSHFTAPFAHFRHEARVFTRREGSMTWGERVVSGLLLKDDEVIVRRCRKVLARSWDSFEKDQGVDPFGPHARVEFHLGGMSLLPGSWTMFVYWEADHEGWRGMQLVFRGMFVWPVRVEEVF